ncbi:MAG: ABC transporter permease, partial [Bacteroidota bacterium]
MGFIPEFLAPAPSAVAITFAERLAVITGHALITGRAILVAFFLGLAFAVGVSTLTFSWRVFQLLFEPILVLSQVIPKVALAPIILVLMGKGIESRALVGALICFFPFYSNIMQGLRSVGQELILQARLAAKPEVEILFCLRFIFAVPYLVSAARSAILLAVIGVIVAEFLGLSDGLGFLILDSSARFDTRMMFASITAISITAGLFY